MLYTVKRVKMLNRRKMMEQIQQSAPRARVKKNDEAQLAQRLWHQIAADPLFREQIIREQSSVNHQKLPLWQGSLDAYTQAHLPKNPYVVVGTDGSQIYPDRHSGTHWYVINIGSITLHYGTVTSSVKFDSFPQIFVGAEEDNRTEIIDAQRSVLECKQGYDLLLPHKNETALFLIDGPLRFWNAGTSGNKQELAVHLQEYIQLLQQFYENDLLIAGYTSVPASRDLVQLLIHAHHDTLQKFEYVNDKDVAAFFLQPGFYSTLFSHAGLSAYPVMLQPWFFYFYSGYEIARIEVPFYIAKDPSKIAMIMSIIFDQIVKGQGYPVCLAEAHEQAVIKEADRAFFYQMLQTVISSNDEQGSMSAQSYQPSQKIMRKKRALV